MIILNGVECYDLNMAKSKVKATQMIVKNRLETQFDKLKKFCKFYSEGECFNNNNKGINRNCNMYFCKEEVNG